MDEIIQSLMVEKEELDEKLERINSFIANPAKGVRKEQLTYLYFQHGFMRDYSNVLDLRIKDLSVDM